MKDIMVIIKLMMVEKRDVVLSIIFGIIAGLTAVALFAMSGFMISKSALSPPLYVITIMTALLKLFGSTKSISRYAERYFSHRATFTILSNLRVSFYEKLEPLAPGIFGKYRSGDLLSRIVGDVESLQNFFLRVFYPPIVLVIVFLSTIFFTSFYSLYAALLLLVGLFLTAFIIPALFALQQRKIDSRVREDRGKLSTDVTELLHGFRELKIYQKLEEKETKLLESADLYVSGQEQEGMIATFNQSVNTLVALMVSWSVLALGAFLVTDGQLDGLFLAMLVMISLNVFESAAPMAVFPAHLEDSRRAASRLFSIVGEEAQEVKRECNEQLDDRKTYSIEMDDVTFTYPEETRESLKNIHLLLPAGSKTAIVGPSGSGKSTLLQLLLKMFQADNGDIRIGGMEIQSLSQESVWKQTNVILQENHFFFGTIRENLMLAKDGVTDEDLKKALLYVKLESFSLDDPVLEKGENLSGGEKQRLAIARALLKNAPVWLLDEPTSSIDALTEKIIYDYLFQTAKDQTVVLVSHRLTGLEAMDQIIVMEQGRIIESGTFDKLMEKKGYFYEMKQIEKSVFM
ncbi:thiol reductant ABC exporter subunit CydC [Domibacillus epiphyticus]|uniref:Thiol reductant ABC exporter subunit CydC n=1 Tax=Domibacillus epiphyticus TaxID=1714355 RepID=A0A1V2ABK7_9BACI|nr:thiol reductant ABC exporter subunit CydC [Domibacillus epiphyticus]OMP68184.1 thiol reductant ABC exporter subunit CydC [Domibacillus epiphyticus]